MSPSLALSTATDPAEPTGPHLRSVPQPWHLGDARRAVLVALLGLALAALPPAVDGDPPAPAPPLRPRPEA
jgi:hypothetical protein